MNFPSLYSGARSPYIPEAYKTILKYHEKGRRLLASEEPDVLRMKIVADDIHYNAMPYVNDLRKMSVVPKRWITRIETCCVGIEARLRDAIKRLEGLGIDDTR